MPLRQLSVYIRRALLSCLFALVPPLDVPLSILKRGGAAFSFFLQWLDWVGRLGSVEIRCGLVSERKCGVGVMHAGPQLGCSSVYRPGV